MRLTFNLMDRDNFRISIYWMKTRSMTLTVRHPWIGRFLKLFVSWFLKRSNIYTNHVMPETIPNMVAWLTGRPSGTSGPQEARFSFDGTTLDWRPSQHPLTDSSFSSAFQTSNRMVRDSYFSHWLTTWPAGIAEVTLKLSDVIHGPHRVLLIHLQLNGIEDSVWNILCNNCWLSSTFFRSRLLLAAWRMSRPTSLLMRLSEFTQSNFDGP